jgi:hypothetical protein
MAYNDKTRTSQAEQKPSESELTPFKIADKYLASANSNTGALRLLYYTFVPVGLYIFGVFSGVNDLQILLESPIDFPIIRLSIPFMVAFCWIPFLYLIYHLVVFLQFYLLSIKLHKLQYKIRHMTAVYTSINTAYTNTENSLSSVSIDGDLIIDRLSEFVLGHLLLVRHTGLIKFLLALVLWFSLVLLPSGVLVWTLYKFLPYHDPGWTRWHTGIVMLDLILITIFWPNIFHNGFWTWLWKKMRGFFRPCSTDTVDTQAMRYSRQRNVAVFASWLMPVAGVLYSLYTLLFKGNLCEPVQFNLALLKQEVHVHEHLTIKDEVITAKEIGMDVERQIRDDDLAAMKRIKPLRVKTATLLAPILPALGCPMPSSSMFTSTVQLSRIANFIMQNSRRFSLIKRIWKTQI